MNVGSVVIELDAEKFFDLQPLRACARRRRRRRRTVHCDLMELRLDTGGFAHDLNIEILPAHREFAPAKAAFFSSGMMLATIFSTSAAASLGPAASHFDCAFMNAGGCSGCR